LAEYDLFLFPTLGENYGHVISEALASGCPVVISDQTPWRNLEAEGINRNGFDPFSSCAWTVGTSGLRHCQKGPWTMRPNAPPTRKRSMRTGDCLRWRSLDRTRADNASIHESTHCRSGWFHRVQIFQSQPG
jgi:hypothetical protein